MVATLILREQYYEVASEQTLNQALIQLGIDPGSVLAIRDGFHIQGDALLSSGDIIRLIHVISGG
jgi:sulfur carrier protein ThiS